jgi:hypothetical protein
VRSAYEAALRFDPAHVNALDNMHRFFPGWQHETPAQKSLGEQRVRKHIERIQHNLPPDTPDTQAAASRHKI